MQRVFQLSVSSVYPLYVQKVERKGRTVAELDRVISWLTSFDSVHVHELLDAGTTFQDFFAQASLNPNASKITGVICGIRVEDIEDPLTQQIRYLDKLVDELAQGKDIEKILRR
ncbi:DUF2200 domain-containing protein [Pseudoclavibacter caeni]|jgi:hypothetical protein|uniref:DUF2200 domain-containing protein n=1 Tax=Pseudoclavibacter caeni TaxID=908846 RepID=A0A7C8BPJ9_9MICO|nr:DUF2200 domain-containing protein [Pseudoclavibacter caeni]KAB1633384.1 DUF2200 domain-containing protein [Pseudoclavibacter caeni]NYJ96636.1 hypothetical protein [Pseudoclavibacter caeni]